MKTIVQKQSEAYSLCETAVWTAGLVQQANTHQMEINNLGLITQ